MKKTYLCPQADIQKVETSILCSSGGFKDPTIPPVGPGGRES